MRAPSFILLLSMFLAGAGNARGDLLVLVHGFSANADTWLRSGVMQVLAQSGWRDAGLLVTTPKGAAGQIAPIRYERSTKTVFRAQLPAGAPLQIQAAQLHAQLRLVRRMRPAEPLTLVGHSTGGLVARLSMQRGDSLDITRMVSIATPNLGTARATQALNATNDKPFFCPGPGIDFLKSVFAGNEYHYLRASQGALVDLSPAAPGTLIHWLNRQPHPKASYHAVVRMGPHGPGDKLVPGFSQDLNQVPALRGAATVHPVWAGHALHPGDGHTIASILESDD